MPFYRIKDASKGEIVIRKTEDTSTGHALHPDDQAFADAIVAEIQEACRYFYEADPPPYPGCPEVESLSDDQVQERMKRMDDGENTREAVRTKQKRYPLVELPFERQRALIERIERLKRQWQFERLSDEEGEELYQKTLSEQRFGYNSRSFIT